MYFRSSSSVVTFRLFLKVLYLFFNKTIKDILIFPHFSPTFIDILSWKIANDFVWMNCKSSSSAVNFWRSYACCWTKNLGNTDLSFFFLYAWHVELIFCIRFCFNALHTDQVRVPSLLTGYTSFWTLNIGYSTFLHFSYTCFKILCWNFVYGFVLWTSDNFKCAHQVSLY